MTAASSTAFRPKLSAGVRVVNALGRRLKAWGMCRPALTEEAVLRAARRKTGLDDFGDPRFREPLRALLESYRNDGNLTFIGRVIAQRLLVGVMANRLRLRDELSRTPRIGASAIPRPLFVIGLPRTGTTLLHNLLSQDPSARPLLFWESFTPSPPPDPAARWPDPRIRRARRMVDRLYRTIPDLPILHEMDPCGPNECLGLLMNTFVTPLFRGRVPVYLDWLESAPEAEVHAAYREYRQQLQVLQGKTGPCRWVLKCPSHLFGLTSLLAVFPDACLVQTHRDIAEAAPSLCSLTAAFDGLMYERLDPADIGRRTLRILDALVSRSLEARARIPAGRVLDVDYEQLIGDPEETVRRIYAYFDLDYSDSMSERVRAYLAVNPRHKHGVHRYSLDDFHLDRAALRARFVAYSDRFGIGERCH